MAVVGSAPSPVQPVFGPALADIATVSLVTALCPERLADGIRVAPMPGVVSELMVVLTFYCGGRCCVSHNAEHGLTKSGARPAEGWTVAADTRHFPIGTILWIDGLGLRMVQDVGSGVRGSHIDVYVREHAHAVRMGRKRAAVRVIYVPDPDRRQSRRWGRAERPVPVILWPGLVGESREYVALR